MKRMSTLTPAALVAVLATGPAIGSILLDFAAVLPTEVYILP